MQRILQVPDSRTTNATRPRLRGNNQCKCSACGELFAMVSTFDKHRVGDYASGRRCISRSEMLAKGWVQYAAQFWIRGHRSNIAPVLSPRAQNRRSFEGSTHVAVAT